MSRIPLIFLLATAFASTPARGQAGRASFDARPGIPEHVRVQRPPDLQQDYHRAERAWRAGTNLAESRARLDRVLARIPDDVQALRLRVRVLLDLGLPAPAVVDAVHLSRLDPGAAETWLLSAEAWLAAGLADSASVSVARASALVGNRFEDHLNLSWLAERLGRLAEAETYARVGLAIAPDRPASTRRLAHVFMAQGRPGDAATLLERALERGVFRTHLIDDDPLLAPLREHPTLARRF